MEHENMPRRSIFPRCELCDDVRSAEDTVFLSPSLMVHNLIHWTTSSSHFLVAAREESTDSRKRAKPWSSNIEAPENLQHSLIAVHESDRRLLLSKTSLSLHCHVAFSSRESTSENDWAFRTHKPLKLHEIHYPQTDSSLHCH